MGKSFPFVEANNGCLSFNENICRQFLSSQGGFKFLHLQIDICQLTSVATDICRNQLLPFSFKANKFDLNLRDQPAAIFNLFHLEK